MNLWILSLKLKCENPLHLESTKKGFSQGRERIYRGQITVLLT